MAIYIYTQQLINYFKNIYYKEKNLKEVLNKISHINAYKKYLFNIKLKKSFL